MALTVEEIDELEISIMEEIPNKITEILLRLNLSGKLEDLLELLGMKHLLGPSEKLDTYKAGKIVVVGGTEVKEKDLIGVVKSLKLDKSRFEFCLEYDETKRFDYKKMQYQPGYRVILCGPIPHSCEGKGDSGSIIAEMEKSTAYPRVFRLENNQELKITKTNFKKALEDLIEEQYI